LLQKLISLLFKRVTVVATAIIVQLALLLLMLLRFQEYFFYFYAVSIFLSILVVLYIINNKSNPAYKIAWIIPILLVPVFGGLIYLLFGGNKLSAHERKKMARLKRCFRNIHLLRFDALGEIDKISPDAANQSRYILNAADSPPFQNTSAEYLPSGEAKFQRMLEELEKARHYIFLEYFIIQEGKMWNPILEILERKAREGLDVRVMYDDIGCLLTLPSNYRQTLEQKGIRCCVFNPFVPVLSSRLNNRDHRKICVIDGHTGFTGGINLADEYINAYEKHGHWKDTAVLLRGDAVWSLTVMFLSMWDYVSGAQEDFSLYLPRLHQLHPQPCDGFVQPYTDSPLDDEAVGETVYLNLINKAKRYVYITTPYLIISNEMITALCTAAKSGVDVRIITPHIADKWYVHAVTRAYYETLAEAGVKIFEYTPGFIHAKAFTVDDELGVVGTINLDFRSLYLHFECAAWLFRCRCILDMRDDFLATQAVSQEITLKECRAVRLPTRLLRSVLRLFAPLM
jgi:cardiolipin synthase